MSPSRPVVLALAPGILAVLACQPSVESSVAPTAVDYAVFDVAASPPQIPQPSDITLAFADQVPGAQGELLRVFKAQGGFPYDQEVPITFGMVREALDAATGAVSTTTTSLDLASLKPCPGAGCNVLLLRVDGATPAPAPFEASYAADTTSGTLTLRNPVNPANGSRAWPAGARYVAALRGGASGVKVIGGAPIQPQATMYLLTRDKDLTLPENQTVLPGTPAEKAALGLQLELLRQSLLPAFAAVGAFGFPSAELADITTFAVAPATTWVWADPGAGKMPIPSDFLLDPTTNRVRTGIATGLDTLDGFSTTGLIAAETSGLIDATSVTTGNVSLWRSTGTSWTRVFDVVDHLTSGGVNNATYVTQPPQIVLTGGFSPLVGLQPAVPAPIPAPPNLLTLPPLAESTEYGVIITKGVLDQAGHALSPTTLGQILLLSNPVSVGGKSQLAGVDDATAAGLEVMRQAVSVNGAGATSLLTAAGVAKSQVAMAYTFRTQSITSTSVGLTAAPYSAESGAGTAIFAPIAAAPFDTFANVGIPAASFPDVAEFVAAMVPTFATWDKATGALAPPASSGLPWPVADGSPGNELLNVLVAVPLATNPNIPLCPGSLVLKCAPLVVFHHGLNGGHLQMVTVANELAKAGFVVAATDMPFHGDRAFCKSATECTAGPCTPIPGTATQGDAVPPGTCTGGSLALDTTTLTTVASGNYFVSQNFYRSRDAIRRDLLDQSAVILALARPIAPYPQPPGNPLAERLAAVDGIAVDITKVYYAGISLGAIIGTEIAATNPRVSRAVLNVGGGTVVDIFTNSPAFQPLVEQLIGGPGGLIPGFTFAKVDPSNPAFDPAIAAAYLRLTIVMKWILDPADPVNYAAHVGTKLPSPLTAALGPLASTTTAAWGMVANGDTVIPNPFNYELFGSGGIPFTLYVSASAPGNAVAHGFLNTTVSAQDDVAAFLLSLTNPGVQVVLP